MPAGLPFGARAIAASRERARQVERLAEVEAQRRLALGHLLEQARLGPILDVADRKRPDADRAALAERRAVGVRIQSLDAERRHRVDVGGDQQFRRAGDLSGVEHPDAGFRRAQRDLARLDDRRPFLGRRTVGNAYVDAEPAIDLGGVARGALRSLAPDESDRTRPRARR